MTQPTRTSEQFSTGNKREILGWAMYDWGNSAFSTTVVSTLLGPYLTAIARTAAASRDGALIFGIGPQEFFPYIVSLSVVMQVLFLPLIGAIADYTRWKKHFLLLFAYIGALATIGLYFLQGERYLLGGGLFVLANLAFGAAVVFYNAYLPDIASEDQRDFVSSLGFGLGYLGGGILLAVNLVMVQSATRFGLTTEQAVRISLASAGVWWAIFTLIPAFTLRIRGASRSLPEGESVVTVGIKQLWHTLKEIRQYPQTLLFLIAYLIYNDGIQTVIAMGAVYGAEELFLSQGVIIKAALLIQFVAFFGALIFAWVAQRIGAKKAVMVSLLLWTCILIFTWGPLGQDVVIRLPGGDSPREIITRTIPDVDPQTLEPEQLAEAIAAREQARAAARKLVDSNDIILPGLEPTNGFYALGVVIAMVLGGSQALSRSLFAQMIPSGRESEFFSFYQVSERGTSWLGPMIFGLTLARFGSYRVAVVSLVLFFTVGMYLLGRVNVRQAIAEAGNNPEGVVI